MRSGNFERQILVLTILLFCFLASSMAAQKASTPSGVTASGAANDIGADHGSPDLVTLVKRVWRHVHHEPERERQPEAPSSPEKSSASERQPAVEAPASGKKSSDRESQPATEQNSAVGESQEAAEQKVPEIPGAIVRVLKGGEKLPERKNPDYEAWERPELPSGMKLEAVPLGTVRGDGFTREFLHVQWRDLDPIDLWLIKPTSVKNPPVILYLYSYDGSNERYKNDDYCKFLTRNGFAAVGFVSNLTEQRFHDRPRNQTFVSQMQEALATTAHDVQMVLNYLEKRGDVDMNRVGMWADGSGAAIAIMASAVDTRIKALDLLDPWGDWPDWLAKSKLVPENSRADYLKPLFLTQLANLEPLQYFSSVKAQKVRLQYIENGVSVTPREVREKMEAAAPPNAEFVHYDSAKAFASDVAAKGIGFDWIKANVSKSDAQNETRERTKNPLGKVKESESQ